MKMLARKLGKADLEDVCVACESHKLPAPTLPDSGIEALLFEPARELDTQWMHVPPQAMTLEFQRRAPATG